MTGKVVAAATELSGVTVIVVSGMVTVVVTVTGGAQLLPGAPAPPDPPEPASAVVEGAKSVTKLVEMEVEVMVVVGLAAPPPAPFPPALAEVSDPGLEPDPEPEPESGVVVT